MNNKKVKEKTIALDEFTKKFSPDDNAIIEAEKRYYQIVVELKKQRELLGLTQEKLAHLSNVPRTTITKIESGSRNTTLETLMLLAHAMGKQIELRLS